jgi:hypothetical protein
MKQFTVYFELYGKKMKTTIYSDNELQAKADIRNAVKFYKVVEVPPSGDEMFESLKDIFKMK